MPCYLYPTKGETYTLHGIKFKQLIIGRVLARTAISKISDTTFLHIRYHYANGALQIFAVIDENGTKTPFSDLYKCSSDVLSDIYMHSGTFYMIKYDGETGTAIVERPISYFSKESPTRYTYKVTKHLGGFNCMLLLSDNGPLYVIDEILYKSVIYFPEEWTEPKGKLIVTEAEIIDICNGTKTISPNLTIIIDREFGDIAYPYIDYLWTLPGANETLDDFISSEEGYNMSDYRQRLIVAKARFTIIQKALSKVPVIKAK